MPNRAHRVRWFNVYLCLTAMLLGACSSTASTDSGGKLLTVDLPLFGGASPVFTWAEISKPHILDVKLTNGGKRCHLTTRVALWLPDRPQMGRATAAWRRGGGTSMFVVSWTGGDRVEFGHEPGAADNADSTQVTVMPRAFDFGDWESPASTRREYARNMQHCAYFVRGTLPRRELERIAQALAPQEQLFPIIGSVRFVSKDVVLASDWSGTVFRSGDRGSHWEVVAAFPNDLAFLPELAPLTSSIVFATEPEGGLMRSDDSGITWRRLTAEQLLVDGVHSVILNVASTSRGVFALRIKRDNHQQTIADILASDSSGLKWSEVGPTPIPPGSVVRWSKTLFSDGPSLILSSNDREWISDDDGRSWTSTKAPSSIRRRRTLLVPNDGGAPTQVSIRTVRPSGYGAVWGERVGTPMIAVTNDGGAKWKTMEQPQTLNVTIMDVACNDQGDCVFFGIGDKLLVWHWS